MMKTRYIALMAAALVLASGISCSRKTPTASKIKLSHTELFVSEGQTASLSATVLPEGADQGVVWKSLKPDIATVAPDGTVTGIAGGKTFVTATTGHVTSGCTVNVMAHVTGVHLDRHEAMVELDGVILLEAFIEPEVAYNDTVYWSSTDPEVAVVGNGVVTGMKIGRADIVVTTAEGGFTDTCHVEVGCSVKSITLQPAKTRIDVGETAAIAVSMLPANATDKTLTWTSSDTSVATVDAQGNVKGIDRGKVTITAKANVGGASASCEIEVYAPVTGMSVNKTTLQLYVGDRETLEATVIPANANNPKYTWSSSASTIASVGTATGQVTALKAGEADIIAKSQEKPDITAVCHVTVIQGTAPVSGVVLEPNTLRLVVGGTAEVFAKVLPVDAANKGVTWTTSSSTVASVSSTGLVTAKDCGTCTITATTKEGGFTAQCTVTVVGFDTGNDGYNDHGYIWQD